MVDNSDITVAIYPLCRLAKYRKMVLESPYGQQRLLVPRALLVDSFGLDPAQSFGIEWNLECRQEEIVFKGDVNDNGDVEICLSSPWRQKDAALPLLDMEKTPDEFKALDQKFKDTQLVPVCGSLWHFFFFFFDCLFACLFLVLVCSTINSSTTIFCFH